MHLRIRLHDKWFRLLGIPFIAFMSHVIFFNENHMGEEKFSYWQIFLISLAEGVLLWESNRLVLLFSYNRFPSLEQSAKRIVCLFIGCMSVTMLVRYLNIWFYDKTLFWGYIFPPEGYWYNIMIALLYVVMIAGLYEGVYYFQQWKRSFAETEKLKRIQLQTELDALKAQVNPHFLFNSLGSLSSLVMEDQQKAVAFIGELAAVYRYVLQANEKHLVTLKEEMQFIENYFQLMQTRFDDAIGLDLRILPQHYGYLIPPLTLQLLLENAIKHNVILPEEPLVLKLSTDDKDQLVVSNNLNRRHRAAESGKLGLRNIIAKYELLQQRPVTVRETDSVFEVTVPLIKNGMYESTDR